MGWVYMVHADHQGGAKFPDDASVIGAQEARGWVRYTMPPELDPDAPNLTGVTAQAAEAYEPERVLSEDEVAELKGAALEQKLTDAGLSKSGTADEKRARLAEYEAGLANPTEGSE
jgi:hypothetical protein